jgi:hypothetical protein
MRRTEWQKVKLDDGAYESAGVFDVDNDGVLDIVCGAHWYRGPNWTKHPVCEVSKHGEYYDDFSTIAMDVNGDGYLDVITGGWWGCALRWLENPKGDPRATWNSHVIDSCGNIETTRAWDVDGDGELEICPNTPGAPLVFYKLVRDQKGKPTGAFKKFRVSPEGQGSGHGLGFGDVTGSGRGCFVVHNGFWEPGRNALTDPWTFHQEFEFGSASVPILVVDVNGDGVNELVVGQAHGYGLDYYTQRLAGGRRVWTKHPVDPYFSQYHEMHWVDVDGDGKNELVTGNRYRAHCGNEPGETDVVGVYIFKWNGESFTKQVVDHGTVPHASGTGIFMQVVDIDRNGRLDIVAPGKDGLYLFKNMGPEQVGKK